MILGIDLATVNCGLCFMQKDETCSFATIGIKDIGSDESILQFAKSLAMVVADQVCYVDFHFNECFLPNKKKHISVKYFLSGIIFVAAKEVNFIKPAEVREHFGFDKKTKKYLMHEQMFDSKMMKECDEHKRDAYLLALMGFRKESENEKV